MSHPSALHGRADHTPLVSSLCFSVRCHHFLSASLDLRFLRLVSTYLSMDFGTSRHRSLGWPDLGTQVMSLGSASLRSSGRCSPDGCCSPGPSPASSSFPGREESRTSPQSPQRKHRGELLPEYALTLQARPSNCPRAVE